MGIPWPGTPGVSRLVQAVPDCHPCSRARSAAGLVAGPHGAGGSATCPPGWRDFASGAHGATWLAQSLVPPLRPLSLLAMHQGPQPFPGATGTAACRDRDSGWSPTASVWGATAIGPNPGVCNPVPGDTPSPWGAQGVPAPEQARPAAARGGRGERGVCRERTQDLSDGFAGSSRTRTSPGRRDAEPPPNRVCWGGRAAALLHGCGDPKP